MALRCGIVGLPNVGKSTLFNCVSSGKAQAANFPFCTIEPNLGSTQVPDPGWNSWLPVHPDALSRPPWTLWILPGSLKGQQGRRTGKSVFGQYQETDAILHILRCFDDPDVVHVDGSVDPLRDKEIIETELQLRDLETVESRIAKVQKQAVTGGDKQAAKLAALLVRYRDTLSRGQNARTVALITQDEERMARELFLLTNKPVLYVFNVDEKSALAGNAYTEKVAAVLKETNRTGGCRI